MPLDTHHRQGPGRPPLPDDERRDVQQTVHLTPAEWDRLIIIIGPAGSFSAFCRAALMHHAADTEAAQIHPGGTTACNRN